MRIAILFILGFLLASCGAPEDELEDRLGELVLAKNRWLEYAGDRPYSYTLQRGQSPPCTVVVTEPGLLRSDWMDYRSEGDGRTCRVDPTMRELFEFVLEMTGEQLAGNIAMDVEYDEKLGYPRRIFLEDLHAIDGSGAIVISDVVFEDR